MTVANVDPQLVGESSEKVVSKQKTLASPFCLHVGNWVNEMKALRLEPSALMFLRYLYPSQNFLWYAKYPIAIQRFDEILQVLDPSMTSCLFRYGHTEKLYRLGFTEHELKEIGVWSSSRMPEIYAERKSLTPSQKRFADDVR